MTHQEISMFAVCLQPLKKLKESRRLILLIVAVALLLDNMLLSTVVPIIPHFLATLENNGTEIPAAVVETTTAETRSICYQEKDRFPTVLPLDIDTTTTNSVVTSEASIQEMRHRQLVNENVEVGIMFASKPVVQAITNPFIGPLTNRYVKQTPVENDTLGGGKAYWVNKQIGYSIPMFSGFVIMFLSTLIFAIGTNYATLFIARSLQGVGSACTSVAGMGMLAMVYPEDKERGNAMALALGGLALGVLIGPPFGGVTYQFLGKAFPFCILAVLALLDGLLQLIVLQPKVTTDNQQGTSLLTLIKDPYILVAAGALAFANMGISSLEPSLPLWMMDTMNAPEWQQGAAFLPASISYLIGTNIFGPLGHKMGRWLASMVGLIVIGTCVVCIPLARTFNHLILPNAGIGFAIGMVDSSMMPMLGYLVDIRHTSIYGSVYAIGDVALCVGFTCGPLLSSSIVNTLGFKGLVYTTGAICFLYAPSMLLLRRVPGKDENQTLLNDTTVRYISYTNEDSPEEEIRPTLQPQWVK